MDAIPENKTGTTTSKNHQRRKLNRKYENPSSIFPGLIKTKWPPKSVGLASKPFASDLESFSDSNSQLLQTPWNSPIVIELAGKMGRDKSVRPMMIEAPTGVILSAVGEEYDHKVASKALVKTREENTKMKRNKSERLGLVKRNSRSGISFGAVYEHRDCFGKPRYIGETGILPEMQTRIDCAEHHSVRKLLHDEKGKTAVVWAGVGKGEVGSTEMQEMRKAIQKERAERMNAAKLRSIKPYSKHGFGDI